MRKSAFSSEQKDNWLERLAEGEDIKDIADEAGVTIQTVYRWRASARNVANAQTTTENAVASMLAPIVSKDIEFREDPLSIGELRAENEMLRKAIAQLYVEKLKLLMG